MFSQMFDKQFIGSSQKHAQLQASHPFHYSNGCSISKGPREMLRNVIDPINTF